MSIPPGYDGTPGAVRFSAAEVAFYKNIWTMVVPDTSDKLHGSQAVEFLERSGIPREILHQIWCAVDPQEKGYLTFDAFCMSMRLVAHAQSNPAAAALTTELMMQEPPALPNFEGLLRRRSPSEYSSYEVEDPVEKPRVEQAEYRESDDPFFLRPHDLRKYASLFLQYDSQRSGYVQGSDARDLLLRSGLSRDELAEVWRLSDVDTDGRLTFREFIVAMHLVTINKKRGRPIPHRLPNELLKVLDPTNTVENPEVIMQQPRPPGRSASPLPQIPRRVNYAPDVDVSRSRSHSNKPPRRGRSRDSPDRTMEQSQPRTVEKVTWDQPRQFSEAEARQRGRSPTPRTELPDRTELPHRTVVPHRTELPPRTELPSFGTESRRNEHTTQRDNVRDVERLDGIIEADRRLNRYLMREVDGMHENVKTMKDIFINLERETRREAQDRDRLKQQQDELLRQMALSKKRLDNAKEDRHRLSLQTIGMRRDRDHYAEEASFLERALEAATRDISLFEESEAQVDKAFHSCDTQIQELERKRKDVETELKAEKDRMRQDERMNSELKAQIDRLQKETESAYEMETSPREKQRGTMKAPTKKPELEPLGPSGEHTWSAFVRGENERSVGETVIQPDRRIPISTFREGV